MTASEKERALSLAMGENVGKGTKLKDRAEGLRAFIQRRKDS